MLEPRPNRIEDFFSIKCAKNILRYHLGFLKEYLIAASSIVIMIGLYTKSVLKTWRLATIISGLLIFLYGYLYVILQLHNYALLIGSITLFLVLALIMFLTRKIDWGNLKST